MNYITNFFRAGCVALLAVLILAPGAFAQTAPDPPTNLEARAGAVDETTGDQHGRIALSWSPVLEANSGGFAVTDYIIEFTADPTDATSWAVVAVDETAPADPAAADAKYTLVHILPEEADDDAATASYNLTRHYRVKAVNVIGTGDPSTVAMATTHNVPDAPTDLAAVAGQPVPDPETPTPQNGRITVTWNAVTVPDGALPVTSYILEVTDDLTDDDSWTASGDDLAGVGGGTVAITQPTGDETEYSAVHNLSSLDPSYDLTRHYRVKAVNAASADGGDPSDPKSATTHDVPDAPTGLATGAVAVNADDDALNDIPLSWNSVLDANNGGLPITGYEVEFLLDPPGTTWDDVNLPTELVAHVAGTVDTVHVGRVENATTPETYYYRVRAVSAAGMGDWSSVTPGVKLALPSAPTNLIVRAVDQQESIDLFWEAPMNDGEPPVTGYRIEKAPDDETSPGDPGTWEDLETNYAGRSYRDRDLTAGDRYHYRVSAVNVVGTSTATDPESAISSNKALMPRNLTATVAADMRSITLTWDGPIADEDNLADGGSPITGYKIEVSTDAGATWADVDGDKPVHDISDDNLLTSAPGSEFVYTHEDVAAGTSYIYRVSAVNDAGPGHASTPSASVSIDAGVPDAPTGLSATAAADADGITLEWSAPAETGGSDITSWKIEVSEDYDAADPDAATWAEEALTVTDPDDTAVPPTTTYSAVHTGLTPGATYTYRVSATNSAGTGNASEVDSAVAPDIPGAPTGLTATANGENTINLSWTAPVVPTGASPIAGWKIEVSADYDAADPTAATWMEEALTVTDPVAPATMHTASHTGLNPATTRHYRVSAINGVPSTGSASNVANATTAARGIVTRYAVSEDGSSDANCITASNPCTLQAALDASEASDNNDDLILVRIRRAGETATIGDDIAIGNMVTLGVYVRGASAAAKGAVSFTGSVAMTDEGDLMTHKDASLHFDEIEIAGMSSIDKLTIGDDLTISEDDEDNSVTSVLAVDELSVSSGKTLTLGEGVNVRVRLTKTKDAVGKMNGKFDVKGAIDGGGDLWIAHTAGERAATKFDLLVPEDYQPNTAIAPSRVKFTVDDCLMVTGGGTVENDLHFVAAGNVCVILGEVGNLVAVGSVAGDEMHTTDVIFRNGVTVTGDVQQWNDARVLFESSSTIEGDATLEYGDGGVGTDFGTPISATGDFVRAMGSGLEFGGASNTIEGDLELKFDGESGSTEVFLNVAMSGGYHMTTVEGDLVIEDGGGIRLHGHPGVRTDRNNNPRAHNLSVEGDVFAYTHAMITMEHAAMSTIVGDGLLCSAPGLKHGTKVMLSGDVVFTEGATLTIPTVVIADDVEVEEEGTLMATTVHVTEDGELDSEESVLIEDALVLQGDGLEGSLAAGSTVNNLTYATVDSDEIDLGASVTRLSVNVDMDQELRISEAITVTNLGLCSGTMVLIDTDTDENTLTVTDLLTVMDGHLGLDSNRPGSAGTDIQKENEDRTADHSYILKYVTAGERMAGPEWFGGANAPRKLAVDHADAVIIADEAKSLAEGIHIFKGHLHMKGEDSHLTIGPSGLYDANPAGGPFLVVDTGELHSNGNNVQVHGVVMVATSVRQVGKIMTGGGELHVLGMTTSKNLDNASAVATLGSVKVGSHPGGIGTIDVGDGALQLGPEAMNPKDGLHGDWQFPIDNADARPHVKLDVIGSSMVTGMIRVPSGSKQTEVIGVNFGAIVFDGTKTPNKNRVTAANPENWDGTLYVIDADKNVTVDSLGASNGAVEFHGTKATVNKDAVASSVAIYQELKTLEFKGDLAISGTGGFSSRGGDADNRRSLMIGGDYSQETTQTRGGVDMHNPEGGSYLSPNTDKTVMGSFMTSGAGLATRYSTQSGTSLTVKGDFGFGLTAAGYMLSADLEFSGKESQMVSSAVTLGDVLVNNSKGLVLTDSVGQGASSVLTLTSGVISTDSASTWMVKNTGIEEDVRGRNNALTTCDNDENCASVIMGGSRRAHMTAGVSRYVMKGNSGAGEMSGGYLFPVGGMSGDRGHYRPLILQLEDDLSEATSVTVTPMMASDDPGEINILVPVQGGSLTLNAYADMFWKVESKETPDQNPHIRIAAGGLSNVFDDSRLRMVQWDCDWSNARLAGMQIIGSDNASFAENGYVNGVLNLTQQSVEIGTCAILGVAANGIENPIHMDPLTGGLARIQFIHNLPLPFPVDLFLDGVKLMGGLNFQSATGYGHYAAGDHVITVNPVVPPGVVAAPIEIPLPSLVNEQNYAVIAHGSVANPSVKILSTKLRSSVDNVVDAILVHGSGDLGDVDVRILDPADNMTPTKLLANNFSFDSATRYISLDPGAHNVQVTSPDNREEVNVYYVDLNGYQGETLILNLSGGKDDLGFMGVRNNGDVFLSQVVTGVEEEGTPEIPTEFTLHGNYPNPFNPSTRIQFDLPESAEVSVQVVDMLGRQVMALPARQVEAGANRTLELSATNLASGTYLYRIIATGAESRYVKTGRMMLVK